MRTPTRILPNTTNNNHETRMPSNIALGCFGVHRRSALEDAIELYIHAP